VAEDYPLKGVKWDKIFSLSTLNYDRRYRESLEKMFEALVPGGQAVFIICSKTDAYDTHKHLKEHPDWEHADVRSFPPVLLSIFTMYFTCTWLELSVNMFF